MLFSVVRPKSGVSVVLLRLGAVGCEVACETDSYDKVRAIEQLVALRFSWIVGSLDQGMAYGDNLLPKL